MAAILGPRGEILEENMVRMAMLTAVQTSVLHKVNDLMN